MKDDTNFICRRCSNQLPPSPEPLLQDFIVNNEQLEVVQTFCYLGDMIGQAGGCNDATTARVKSAWKSFRELLPILTNSCIPFKMRGHIFNSCVRSVMLHASETWAPTADDMR